MISAIVNRIQVARLLAGLAALEPKISRKILREESRKAAKTFLLPAAKSNTPRDSGLLRRNIKIIAIKRSRVAVGVRLALTSKKFGSKKFYGGFVEYGTPDRNMAGVRMIKKTADDQGFVAGYSFARAVSSRITKEMLGF